MALINQSRTFMSVFTIFCHGTGGASTKGVEKSEIVNLFSSSVAGINGSHYRSVPTPDSDWSKTGVKHSTGRGDSRADFITLEGVGGAGDPRTKSFDANTGDWMVGANGGSSVFASATGKGVDINVVNAVNYVIWKLRNNHRPTAINMMGWSRGAVECIRIAHALHHDTATSNIPVNIFAIDPVAGAGHNSEIDAINVHANVRTLVSVISLGENRRAFAPMVEESFLTLHDKATQYVPLHMPGVHDTIAKYNNSAGKLSFNLCYRFLQQCGTSMGATDMFAMSDANCLQNYGLLLAGRGGTFGMHGKTLSDAEKGVKKGQGFFKSLFTGLGRTSRELDISPYVSSKKIFFNVHHEALFATQCPATYAAHFGASRGANGASIAREMISLGGSIGVSAAEAHKAALADLVPMQPVSPAFIRRKVYLRNLSLVERM